MPQSAGQLRRQDGDSLIRQADDPRAQEGGGAEVRFRLREVAQQRHRVLDLVSLEEPETFVDIRQNAAGFDRLLEIAMAVARAEQDRDVRRLRLTRDTRGSIANGCLLKQPCDFRNPDPTGVNGPLGASAGTAVIIDWNVGALPIGLAPGQTYYFSVRNLGCGQDSCDASTSVNWPH